MKNNIDLSKYEESQTIKYYNEYKEKSRKIVSILQNSINQDLESLAKSTDATTVYQSLKGWLLKFYAKELKNAFTCVGYDYDDFEKNIIIGFIMTLLKDETRARNLFNPLLENNIVLEVKHYEDGRYEVITKNFGTIICYKARKLFNADKEVMKKIEELKDNLKDACHELSYFLIKRYSNLKAITGVMERDLNF